MELWRLHSRLLKEGEPVIRQRGVFFRKNNVPSMLDAFGTATGQKCGQALQPVAGPEVAAVANNATIVETAPFKIFRFLESIEEPGE